MRDFARLLSLVKAATVLRQHHRRCDGSGRLVAEAADYVTVYELVNEMYRTSSGAGEKVRTVVEAVRGLLHGGQGSISGNEREPHVKLSQAQECLTLSKASCSRRVKTALQGGWLVNGETRKGYPFQLGIGDPLPAETGLLQPQCLKCSTVSAQTAEDGGGCVSGEDEPFPTGKGGAHGRAHLQPRALLSRVDSQIGGSCAAKGRKP